MSEQKSLDVGSPLDIVLTPEQVKSLEAAEVLYGAMAIETASRFAGAIGVGHEAQVEFLTSLSDAIEPLGFSERREVAVQFDGLLKLLGDAAPEQGQDASTPRLVTNLTPAVEAEEAPVLDDSVQEEVHDQLADVFDAQDTKEPLWMTVDDPELRSIDKSARTSQTTILVKIFGEDREDIIRRMPLVNRQWVAERIMTAYEQMPVARATKEGKEMRKRHMNLLFKGHNSFKIVEIDNIDIKPAAVNSGLNTVTNSFSKQRLLDAVGLDLDSLFQEAVDLPWQPEGYAGSKQSSVVPDVGEEPNSTLGEMTAEASPEPVHRDTLQSRPEGKIDRDQLEHRFTQAKEGILEVLKLDSKAEEKALSEIFDITSRDVKHGEVYTEIRERLMGVIPSVQEELRAEDRLDVLEQAVIWAVIGRPEPRKTDPRGVESVRGKFYRELKNAELPIKQVITRSLEKIVASRRKAFGNGGIVS